VAPRQSGRYGRGMRRVVVLVAMLFALAVIGGCGGGDDSANENTKSTDAAATPAISSGVESVPIPRDAHPAVDAKRAWEVLGMTYDELVAWYDARLPEGKDFMGWTWCDTDTDTENPTRVYSQGSKTLTVTLVEDTPPRVLIRTKSGSC
jgi:hypothetical protein